MALLRDFEVASCFIKVIEPTMVVSSPMSAQANVVWSCIQSSLVRIGRA
jgi:hypothetical protein